MDAPLKHQCFSKTMHMSLTLFLLHQTILWKLNTQFSTSHFHLSLVIDDVRNDNTSNSNIVDGNFAGLLHKSKISFKKAFQKRMESKECDILSLMGPLSGKYTTVFNVDSSVIDSKFCEEYIAPSVDNRPFSRNPTT